MSKTRRTRSRLAAFAAQHGLCYYCRMPIWLENPDGFQDQWNLARADTWDRRCTAEHLVSRKDGGGDGPENIAAACTKCNQGRHARKAPMEPDAFARYVRARVRQGRWHQPRVLRAFVAYV